MWRKLQVTWMAIPTSPPNVLDRLVASSLGLPNMVHLVLCTCSVVLLLLLCG